MNIGIIHPRLGEAIGDRLQRALPEDTILIFPEEPDADSLAGIEVLIAAGVSADLVARAESLRWVQLTATGVDHVWEPLAGRSVRLAHAGGVPAPAVAEYAWMAILALAKEGFCLPERQRARSWRFPAARRIAGTRLGVVGLGRIGTEIARRASGFDVEVVGVTRSGRPSEYADRVIASDRLIEIAPRLDHLVIAAPGGEGTRGLVSAQVIGALPASACVVNVGRASTLDTGALVAALERGRVRAALLDVHDQEPLSGDSPLWDVPGLWISPHVAFMFPEEGEELAELFIRNRRRYEEGRELENEVSIA